MDEILIEEKKYVSSKQAAKMTGYAKDYIGQLCREGRVPARLVGRSWYVLESAIQDHRFGDIKAGEAVKSVAKESESHSTWQSPRYEAVDAETLPSVNLLQGRGGDSEPLQEENGDSIADNIQDTWQAWFDRFDTVVEAPVAALSVEKEAEIEKEEKLGEKIDQEEEVNIPIRAVHHAPLYQPTPKEYMPSHMDIEIEPELPEDEDIAEESPMDAGMKKILRLVRGIQVAGAVLAVVAVSLAVLGSGYLDTFIISHNQVGLIAGVGLYDR